MDVVQQESGPAQGFPREPGCTSSLPSPVPCFAAPGHMSQNPTTEQGIMSLLSPPQFLWESWHRSDTHLSTDFSSPACPQQNGMGVRCDPATPRHLTPLHGDRAQPCSEPSSCWVFPQGTGAGSIAPKSPSSSPRQPWLHCPAGVRLLGNVLTEGDFSFSMSVRLRGPPSSVGAAGAGC